MHIHVIYGRAAGKHSSEIWAIMDAENYNCNPAYIEDQFDEYKERVHKGWLDVVEHVIVNLTYADIEKLVWRGRVVEILARRKDSSPEIPKFPWIPITGDERPGQETWVLVIDADGYVNQAFYRTNCEMGGRLGPAWLVNDEYTRDIIAWMPLPPAYKLETP